MGKAASPGQSFRSKPRWALGAEICGKEAGAARKRLKRKRIAARRHWVVEDFGSGNVASNERLRCSTRGFRMGGAVIYLPPPRVFLRKSPESFENKRVEFCT